MKQIRNLPSGWSRAKIGDVRSKTEQVDPKGRGKFVYIDIGSVDRGRKVIYNPQVVYGSNAPSRARKLVKSGDTLVSLTRPNLNSVCLVGEEYDGQIASTGFDVLRLDGFDARWIYYIVRTKGFVDKMSGLVQGALYPAIRSADVGSFEIPVAPVNEQRRIADKLDRVLARVDAANEYLSRVGPLLKRFRQAVLDAAVSGKLTNGWRSKNDGREWGWCRLADVANVGTGSTPLKNNSNYYSSRGVPWITSSATGFDFIEASRDYVTELALRECRLKIYPPGTLVVAMYGEGKTRGQVSELVFSATINQACAAVEVVSDLIDIKFLKVFFQANYGKMRLMAEGGSQPNLNLSKIKNLSVPLPSIEEQKEIVRRVSEVMTYSQGIGGRLAAIRSVIGELTPVLLAKAFRGGLVEQNPLDEPASELLARLAEAKATESQNTTRRKRQTSA